jgi:hypothetical protein
MCVCVYVCMYVCMYNFARWCRVGPTINSDSFLEHQQLPDLFVSVSVCCAVNTVFVLKRSG